MKFIFLNTSVCDVIQCTHDKEMQEIISKISAESNNLGILDLLEKYFSWLVGVPRDLDGVIIAVAGQNVWISKTS